MKYDTPLLINEKEKNLKTDTYLLKTFMLMQSNMENPL
jgi:hypothetical protein